jgi:hypothetical protein
MDLNKAAHLLVSKISTLTSKNLFVNKAKDYLVDSREVDLLFGRSSSYEETVNRVYNESCKSKYRLKLLVNCLVDEIDTSR